ncbi:MAG: leucine-rich repeat domain-containing protein [Oscillatoria sp. PMC 1051.18]|nr:leucine-rich repeat domain-containing protein [Oscillatoria sp. PMC 1050.18]MEC5028414.1 leucine-rich repeat domain-containing protein [Oscillatoria sp. PMC 1051.18]
MGQPERERTIKALCKLAGTSNIEEALRILNSQTTLSLSFPRHLSVTCDLSVLESFSNLEYLYISNSKISDLTPLQSLSKLKKLYLEENQISDLTPLQSLSQLEELYLEGNQISDLTPLQSLSNLKFLDVENNKISDLAPLKFLPELKELYIDGNLITDLSPLANLPNLEECFIFNTELPRKYWTRLDEWKPEWLLSEKDAEIRRLLIQQIGYERICLELGATELDTWREYVLLKIDSEIDIEPILLLKMVDPSTNDIYTLRVPPDSKSARDAIRWINHGIDPEEFAIET